MSTTPRQLTRSRDQRIVSGVCGGLAEYLNMDPTLVRVAFAAVTVLTGVWLGLLAYLVGHFVIPEAPLDADRIAPFEPTDPLGTPAQHPTDTTLRNPDDLR
ncbi:PspC domain-containing protein [Desertihabitans brevis]|uniref:PspC domain-containing protein n=1 Tax=Desertihabitans brevis TaxID=2268447 RepID=A0A367YSR7_9ACTN|nr:PspC domain-containing protein [Desertihabitans brevis]RCK68884.1 PspC domain-containing protein [Desertihabitans brevis]